jgi:hypothetical protein
MLDDLLQGAILHRNDIDVGILGQFRQRATVDARQLMARLEQCLTHVCRYATTPYQCYIHFEEVKEVKKVRR